MNEKSVTKTHKHYVTISKDAKETQITDKIMDLLEENEVNLLEWTIIKALLDYKIEDATMNYVIKNYEE